MMARRRREDAILFPWERRRGWLSLPWLRSRPLLATLAAICLLIIFGVRERTRTGVRSTRSLMLVVREAVDGYRADHDGRCPKNLSALTSEGYLLIEPRDAWGRPFQLTCPGRRNPQGYDLLSFGPSGDMRGLDRVE